MRHMQCLNSFKPIRKIGAQLALCLQEASLDFKISIFGHCLKSPSSIFIKVCICQRFTAFETALKGLLWTKIFMRERQKVQTLLLSYTSLNITFFCDFILSMQCNAMQWHQCIAMPGFDDGISCLKFEQQRKNVKISKYEKSKSTISSK